MIQSREDAEKGDAAALVDGDETLHDTCNADWIPWKVASEQMRMAHVEQQRSQVLAEFLEEMALYQSAGNLVPSAHWREMG
jgi:hypothetical protein